MCVLLRILKKIGNLCYVPLPCYMIMLCCLAELQALTYTYVGNQLAVIGMQIAKYILYLNVNKFSEY